MATKQNNYCFVQFKINQITSPGEEIHITGNVPSLGEWHVDKSEKMVTNQQEYPLWKSKENIKVQQDTEIQYKYLIFNRGKFKCWENSANRRVKIGKFCKIVIMDPGSKIIHCISDPNLNNITNSEISKSDNFYEDDSKFIDEIGIGLNSIDINNNEIFSDPNLNMNNEEQFILSNKKNDQILGNQEFRLHNLYQELNVDNSNSNLNVINENANNLNINNSNNYSYNLNNINLMDNIINEISTINFQIFNNLLINQNLIGNNNSDKELELLKIDPNLSEIEKKFSTDDLPLISEDSSKNNLILLNNKNRLFQKIIVCSLFLPIKIENESITCLSEYLYPNLYNLRKYHDSIYYIGFIKNRNSLNEKNREIIYKKLKNEYKMFPIDIDQNFGEELFNYFNDIANPFLNNIKINNIKNNNINNLIHDIHYKFNQIIYKTIMELAGNEKALLLLFDYHFIFVPSLLMKIESDELKSDKIDKFNSNIAIQYIFLNPIPHKDSIYKIPIYQNIIKSLLYSNVIIFPSYINCNYFFNLVKLIDGCEYKVNTDGDIILIVNSFDEQRKNENSSYSFQKTRNVILKVENILPDYQLFNSILSQKDSNNNNYSEFEKIFGKNKEQESCYIFLSIDDIKYLSFVKIKLLGIKFFVENALDEKQKIIFIQVITGDTFNVKKKNSINNIININKEKEKQEIENDNKVTIEEIYSITNEINSYAENQVIEIITKDLNIYEKIYLFSKADCFIKTSDDINSPLSLYEYIMVKLIDHNNNKIKEDKNDDSKNNKNNPKLKQEFPIIEYIISNQIKEIPGIMKYIYVNPFEIKNISNGITKAYRNLINCHKKSNNNNINYKEEHSKEKDFNFIKKYFNNDKLKLNYYRFNNKDFQNTNTKTNTINDNIDKIKLNKVDIKNIIKDYSEITKNITSENEKDKNENSHNKIISINLDFFLSNYNTKKENYNEKNQRLNELLSYLVSISLYNNNNTIILFSSKDQFELDDIITNFLKGNKDKFKDIPLTKLKNFIIASSDGYSFKKICNYFEEENDIWAKIFIDSKELKYSEKDILNNLSSYRNNCSNIRIVPKSNKIFIYTDDCNKEQVDIYIDCFKNEIDSNENLKHILVVNKISNGYCIVNTLNYKALFISRLIKEIINKDRQPKFILYIGFNQTDEVLYKYLDEKKSSIEKYSKTDIYVYCLKLFNEKENINENNIQGQNYKNLFYEDNINEIVSLFKDLSQIEIENNKK